MFQQISLFDSPVAAGLPLAPEGAAQGSRRDFLRLNLPVSLGDRRQPGLSGKKEAFEARTCVLIPYQCPSLLSCPSVPVQRRRVLGPWRQRGIPCSAACVVESPLLFLPNHSHVPSVEGNFRLGEASLARHFSDRVFLLL